MENKNEEKFKYGFICFAVVLIALSPSYLFSYAFSDDYALLGQVIAGFCDTFKWDVLSGRPVFAVLRLLAYKSHTNLDDLAMLRGFSAICAAGFSAHMFLFLQRCSILSNDSERAFLAISLSLIPTFQVYTAWATCCVYVLATWLVLMAYELIRNISASPIKKSLLSFFLIALSFGIYQPAGMTMLAFSFIDICLSENKVSLKKALLPFVFTGIGVISSALMTKVIPLIVYGETLQRAELTHDIPAKFEWFVTGPLSMAISSYDIMLHGWFITIGATLSITGLYLISKSNNGVMKVILTLSFGIGSFSLSLIISESWATWRTMPGLSIVVTSLIVLSLLKILNIITDKNEHIILILAAVISTSASFNIVRGFVIPQKSELQSLSAELSSKVGKEYSGKIMIDVSNPTYNAFSNVQKSDEFGNISLANQWAPWGMALYLKKTKGFNFNIPYKPTILRNEDCKSDCIPVNTGQAMLKSVTWF